MKRLVLSLALTLAFINPAMAGKTPATPTGNDVSYPQCGKTLPKNPAFGIVGVNDGLANNTNPCLGTELAWAGNSTGTTSQPKIQLYVNTANPGLLSSVWPTNNVDQGGFDTSNGTNPYGTCDGGITSACSWQYGWNRSYEDAKQRLATGTIASPSNFTWWLDVETANSWETGTDGQQRNAADLEGMVAYFESIQANVGVYSTSAQWGQIAGSVTATSNLNGVPNWRPGARTLSAAISNCALAPLTAGGSVSVTQYTSGSTDYDYSCN